MNTFKVLQFNMQFGQGWDDAYPDLAPVDLDATLAEIRRHDADLILLQEVEHALPGGEQIEPPPNYTRLQQALTGYHGYFRYPKADPRELPFGIGLAIFSKAPLAHPIHLDLPSPPITFQFDGQTKTPTDRLLIGARTQLGGREVQVFNTHLLAFFMLKSSSSEHPEQRTQVLEELKKSRLPTLLGGDFNVSGHHSLVQQFADAGFATVQTAEVTWRRMPYVLDHIFYNMALRPLHHRVIPTPTSDHHLLLAEFTFTDR